MCTYWLHHMLYAGFFQYCLLRENSNPVYVLALIPPGEIKVNLSNLDNELHMLYARFCQYILLR